MGKLLTCPPEKFSYWLEYRDDDSAGAQSDHIGASFSGADVRMFEKICESMQPPGASREAGFSRDNEDSEEIYDRDWDEGSTSSDDEID